jgi:single-strand DNA-binding protein
MSLNKVILIGNVGKDPEVRYFDSGRAVANFPMATSERGYTMTNGTVVPERTEWHNVVVRNDRIAFVEKWIKKGSAIYVEGKLRTRNYDDQAGVKHYITEIHADRVEFWNFGVKREDGGTSDATSAAQQSSGHNQGVQYAQSTPTAAPSVPLEANESDDLPF